MLLFQPLLLSVPLLLFPPLLFLSSQLTPLALLRRRTAPSVPASRKCSGGWSGRTDLLAGCWLLPSAAGQQSPAAAAGITGSQVGNAGALTVLQSKAGVCSTVLRGLRGLWQQLEGNFYINVFPKHLGLARYRILCQNPKSE